MIKKFLGALILCTGFPIHAQGLMFECTHNQLNELEIEVAEYLNTLNINQSHYQLIREKGYLQLQLKSDPGDNSTLYLRWNPQYAIEDEILYLPTSQKIKVVTTVSKKEIALALMQSGRSTRFSGNACNIEALKDHIGVRQSIVAWAENLHWKFPNGSSAQWNETYWNKGNLHPDKSLSEAMQDFFNNEELCAVGCYTATKIVIIQGVLDYYKRIKKDIKTLNLIKATLRSDGDVLVGVESESMWHDLGNSDQQKLKTIGKLLKTKHQVPAYNFVPGDWVYFVNPDVKSSEIPGYEGSNSIYMGRARFDDFYNDNDHHYLYSEKLKEVYNWRFGVFSRSRDYANIRNLNSDLIEKLSLEPNRGGLVLQNRGVPRLFGFE